MQGFSRRTFLKSAALGLGAAAATSAAACGGADYKAETPTATGLQAASAAPMPASGRIIHYTIYITDGYINPSGGSFAEADETRMAGLPHPIYIWGLTDIDPNESGNLEQVPPGAFRGDPEGRFQRIIGTPVGNAKYPAPFLEVGQGDDVYITVHNRGFFQELQDVQDDHTIHLHGIHAQSPYDGFPESAGSYSEQLRYFWEEPWFVELGATARERNTAWNALTPAEQKAKLDGNAPRIRTNALAPTGGIRSQFNTSDPWPVGVDQLPGTVSLEEVTQYTYYFRAEHPGTYMYHCHVAASEHIQMGMYGALVIRPADYTPTHLTVYGAGTNSDYDVEYTFLLSDMDLDWHTMLEEGKETKMTFEAAQFAPEAWFINGRCFPQTLFPFAWNLPGGGREEEPRYNTYIRVNRGQRILLRYLNMGYSGMAMHQHGWMMRLVGADGRPWKEQHEKFTLWIASGETYDTITLASPAYGIDAPAGSPLSNGPKWRQIYPIHHHDDYKATTNGIYPGGMIALIEVLGVPDVLPNTPTWPNPYAKEGEISIDPVP